MAEPSKSADSLKGKQGLTRLLSAWNYSIKGLQSTWRHEAAFREECYLLCVFFPAAFWLGQNTLEIAVLLMSCLIVLIAELINSAIEAVVDRIGTDHHELSGRAKDTGSAVVLISLLQAVVVWSLMAWNRFS